VPTGDASLLRTRLLFCLIGFAESAFVPFLPLLLRVRGLDAQQIGALLALYAAVGFAAGPLWGYLADRAIGRERTLAISLAGTVVCATVFGLAYDTVALAIFGSLVWLFRSPGMALADALALDRLGVSRRDAYGTVRLWMSATFAIGAIVWGAALDIFGMGLMAPGYACLTALNAALVIAVFRGRWPRPLPTEHHGRRGLALGSAPTVLLFLLALFLMFTPYTATYSFAAVQIAALGGGAVFVGLAGGLQAAAEVPSMIATSRYASRLRPAHIFAAGAVFYLIVYAVWAVVDIPAVLAATRIFAGLGFGLTSVGAVVIADELVPERLRATGQAASKAVSAGLAPVAGSLGGGLVFGYMGATALFVIAAILTAMSALVAWAAESVQLHAAEQTS
jgi:MFS transporter, PPP family, 3-phenylpropionic acid transporter